MKKNKAVHKGNGLLPYPVIVSASQGDILAMNVVLCHYEPYIARLSMRTSIDEYGNPHTSVDAVSYTHLDEFEVDEINQDDNGDFIISATMPIDEWLIGYLLSFGSKVCIIEPKYLKKIVYNEAKKYANKINHDICCQGYCDIIQMKKY